MDVSIDLKHLPLPHTLIVKSLPLAEQHSLKFYVKFKKIEARTFNIKISYMLGSEKLIACTKEDTVTIDIVNPFELEVKYLSSLLEDINKCYVGEDFGVMPVLKCLSPWPVVIENTTLEFVNCENDFISFFNMYFFRLRQFIVLKKP